MWKLDIINNFFKMLLNILDRITSRHTDYTQSYYQFITSPQLAQLIVRIFGFGVSVPKSPNNNSVIIITGLSSLDNLLN